MSDAPSESIATQPTAEPAPDVATIAPAEWPFRELGNVTGDRRDGFQVAIAHDVLAAIHVHGQSETKVEICGVLVGRVYHDTRGAYLLIHGSIAGTASHSHAANVTFTAETWAHIHEEMDKQFPDDRIVGWYHTHPSFGIFLSEMDVFIQANFFNLPWQVAFVYDPIGGDEGMFIWRSGQPAREPLLIETDAVGAAPAADGDAGAGKPADEDSNVFVILVVGFVAILVALLIIFELKHRRPAKAALGNDNSQRSGPSQWIANL